MILLVSFCIIISFGQRVNISMVISAMVKQTARDTNHTECPVKIAPSNTSKASEKAWSHFEQNSLLAAFYIGYVLMHLPGGYIADRWGARHLLNLSLLVSSVTTVLFPAMVLGMPFWVVCLGRVIIGIAQASVFPSISTLMSRWIPKSERATMGGIAFAANSFGIILGYLVSGLATYLADDWPPAFYIWGGAGILWFVFAATWLFSEPDGHPFITDKEKAMLSETIRRKEKNVPLRLGQMMSDPAVWAVIFGQFGHSYLIFFLSTNMPKYFKDILQMDMKSNTFASAFPYVLQWVSSVASGKLGDYNIKKNGWDVALVRKLYTTIASVLPSICLVLTPYMGCDYVVVIILLCLSLFTMGPFYCGLKVNVIDLTSNFSGVLMAIVNGLGAVSGVMNPYIVGWVTPDHTFQQWYIVMWWIFAVATITNIIYLIWAKGERRPWDMNEDDKAKFKAAAAAAKENKKKEKEQKKEDKLRDDEDKEGREERKKAERAAYLDRRQKQKEERAARDKADAEAEAARKAREKQEDDARKAAAKAAAADRAQKKRDADAKRKQDEIDRKNREKQEEAAFKQKQTDEKQQRADQKKDAENKRKQAEADRKQREKAEEDNRKQQEEQAEQERQKKKKEAEIARKQAIEDRKQKEKQQELAEKQAAEDRINPRAAQRRKEREAQAKK